MLKTTISITDPVTNTLEINYYNPYGEKIGTHLHERATDYMNLKEIINSNVPEDYQIVPHFAYQSNISEEIMIAVKSKI